ncbi:hypothetical protein MNBD_GAMMA01-319 [hydrothermal vent metagenome]|uniref:4'-phosphopantetheinyl transferase domain-containing protein n=1 Tax=hydrothermal vent metagenome TaxID=652676 RepID=A0A3B0VDE8_9ZZZZ
MINLHIYQVKAQPKLYSKEKLTENLCHYLDVKPANLNIYRNKNGKPSIAGIDFSISHSKHIIVQAFTKLGSIGVDVEYRNPNRKHLQIAQRYFHHNEYQYLKSLPLADMITSFYNLWTAKEAVCKAQGGRLWYYLADNYLTDNNTMAMTSKGLTLLNFNKIPNFGLTIATTGKPDKVAFIHA